MSWLTAWMRKRLNLPELAEETAKKLVRELLNEVKTELPELVAAKGPAIISDALAPFPMIPEDVKPQLADALLTMLEFEGLGLLHDAGEKLWARLEAINPDDAPDPAPV